MAQPPEVLEELQQLLAGSCEIRRVIEPLDADAETASEQHERARGSGAE